MQKADVDNIFIRANREYEDSLVDNATNDNNKLLCHEFIGALLGVAVLRAKLTRAECFGSCGRFFRGAGC